MTKNLMTLAVLLSAALAGTAWAHNSTRAEMMPRVHMTICGGPAPCEKCDMHVMISGNPDGGLWFCPAPLPANAVANSPCRCKSPAGWQTGVVTIH